MASRQEWEWISEVEWTLSLGQKQSPTRVDVCFLSQHKREDPGLKTRMLWCSNVKSKTFTCVFCLKQSDNVVRLHYPECIREAKRQVRSQRGGWEVFLEYNMLLHVSSFIYNNSTFFSCNLENNLLLLFQFIMPLESWIQKLFLIRYILKSHSCPTLYHTCTWLHTQFKQL